MQVSLFFRAVLICLTGLTLPMGVRADDEKKVAETANEPTLHEIKSIKDIAYYEGDDFDKEKHRLDLYLPKDVKNFPVLFFVHGGSWSRGDRDYYGVYSAIGRFYAKRGIGAVVISYRLSPKVKHPEHIRDVARAFAWTHRNIAKYGGRPDLIFPCGHSAGGHLVALLATNLSYLRNEGVKPGCIAGVIPVSGVFQIPPFFGRVFGSREQCKEASPVQHAKKGLPPFLILYADKDFPYCDRPYADRFSKALAKNEVEVDCREIENSSHLKIVLSISGKDDPVSKAILNFIHAKMQK